ncbi:alpha/beta-hydrolase [Aspergillus avenaceus]|uniref:Alpha/beta-hydrolase n=1 Tax=Aspergillus avenaceus TaxID=36643 RepID=A0A5N6TF90_ASPAV|nr:alpha/beta-hydrolase [Aspergillus avenaceus]
MPTIENVEFPTVDGLTLRGRLYAASQRGPAIILNPGFNLVKEVYVPEMAECFQRANITALIYDFRNYGDSDGLPRNELDPSKQADDYSDAVTFLAGLPIVNPSQIALWGVSYSGSVAVAAAALDKRVKMVFAVCPMTYEPIEQDNLEKKKEYRKLLMKCNRDKVAQMRGNPPARMPMMDSTGRSSFGNAYYEDGVYETVMRLKETIAPNFEPEFTVRTMINMLKWDPMNMLRFLDVPVWWMVPQSDSVSRADVQMEIFESIPGPKRLYGVEGKGHVGSLMGEQLPEMVDAQLSFFRDVLEGKFGKYL